MCRSKIALIAAIAAATFASAGISYAQQAPANAVTVYFTTPLENDPSRVVRLQTVSTPPGGGNSFHRHPGDQWAAIPEGEVTFTVKGQPPRVLKVGDSVYIPRGTVHRNQNLGDKPSRSVELNVIDKDKPALELVPD